jgi:thiol-disulfide isomerase/thioredoxin
MKVLNLEGGGDSVKEFNSEFPEQGIVIAGFFAKWCGHCQQFKPEWEKFTEDARKSSLDGMVVTIPEEQMKDAKCDQSGFSGFPTIRLFNGKGSSKKFIDYEGKRNAKALMDKIKTLVATTPSQGGGGKKRRKTCRRRRGKKRRKTRRRRRGKKRRKTRRRRRRKK